ncbi:pyrroline-5-carboxylate reductase [Lachnospiraceae bacterium PF1-22]|uniref:pyrroline-5-carboxylate reductase n=1 Tax=Ohessyouella blattaphilus TaxID=2949333 RepID=UPI003E1E1F23
MAKYKIGFIGCGNMSGAILKGALDGGVLKAAEVAVYDISPVANEKAASWGVATKDSSSALCQESEMVVLGVKPQQAPEMLAACKEALEDKAALSIVAGITATRLQAMMGDNTRILRVMPNTPAMVKEGATVLCSDSTFTKQEQALAEAIFKGIGSVEWVPEKLMDVACGLSGGGPAYVALFIEALADGAVKQGLPRAQAYSLAQQTCLGSAKMLMETDIHPGALKDMVTSPGGTTIEGIEALERGGFRFAVMDCIKAASEKSKKL